MSEQPRTYAYYQKALQNAEMPFAFVDLDLVAENVQAIRQRAGAKQIRVASKSVRSVAILKRILDDGAPFRGIMSFTGAEAVFLSQKGFDDLLLGYPIWQRQHIEAICGELKQGKTITLMVDSAHHVEHINEIARQANVAVPLCIDVDMSSDYPGLHFGVWRSCVQKPEEAVAVYRAIKESSHTKLDGVMGYEAQIAGVGDNYPGQQLMNKVIRTLKSMSVKEIAKRRAAVVKALQEAGAELRFVNGGGTGSLETTAQEEAVTEVTAGSGFFSSALFDNYKNFQHKPAAGFAIEVVRKPKAGMVTCHGGGYIASGGTSPDKTPTPYLPAGLQLVKNEGAGEVQTPLILGKEHSLQLGDPVFFRHSKSGELCERFNELHLISNGKVVDTVPTYRGEGKCFL